MKRLISSLMLAGLLATGCTAVTPGRASVDPESIWTSNEFQQAQTEKALLSESAIYPWHFLPGSAELTPLGKRDLGRLAEHFARRPGQRLVVRQDQSGDELYQQRLATVRRELATGGADPITVTIDDDMAGGDGVPSLLTWHAYTLHFERRDRAPSVTMRGAQP